MTIAGWLAIAIAMASALVCCMWSAWRMRSMRRDFERQKDRLTQQINLQQDSLQRVVDDRNSLTDTLGAVMMIATSHAASIASDRERQEALFSISSTCRAAVVAQRVPPAAPSIRAAHKERIDALRLE